MLAGCVVLQPRGDEGIRKGGTAIYPHCDDITHLVWFADCCIRRDGCHTCLTEVICSRTTTTRRQASTLLVLHAASLVATAPIAVRDAGITCNNIQSHLDGKMWILQLLVIVLVAVIWNIQQVYGAETDECASKLERKEDSNSNNRDDKESNKQQYTGKEKQQYRKPGKYQHVVDRVMKKINDKSSGGDTQGNSTANKSIPDKKAIHDTIYAAIYDDVHEAVKKAVDKAGIDNRANLTAMHESLAKALGAVMNKEFEEKIIKNTAQVVANLANEQAVPVNPVDVHEAVVAAMQRAA
jgi:uncharacterized protein YxeA